MGHKLGHKFYGRKMFLLAKLIFAFETRGGGLTQLVSCRSFNFLKCPKYSTFVEYAYAHRCYCAFPVDRNSCCCDFLDSCERRCVANRIHPEELFIDEQVAHFEKCVDRRVLSFSICNLLRYESTVSRGCEANAHSTCVFSLWVSSFLEAF